MSEQPVKRSFGQFMDAQVAQKQLREDAKMLRKVFPDLTITGDRIECRKQGAGPILGAKAHVETAGDIDRRITATRLILTGPFAFGLRKKKDTRELYLLVEGAGFAFVLPVDPKKGLEARQVAAKINALGGAI